ncbi:UNKNOWN [Stylonychia lemnae]|uniref:Leucine rich repeat family protein n=1 Tax=Stylonychia lemnae TaxID=5949 RepID=A0A078ALT6_STYLE|nr:UNKNOWN [Stylonychia lemnae]|eukprot:CDW82841.1 UNKNOWN [Stylonychia lemnae]
MHKSIRFLNLIVSMWIPTLVETSILITQERNISLDRHKSVEQSAGQRSMDQSLAHLGIPANLSIFNQDELPSIREANYNGFKLKEDKQSLNIKRYVSPIKILPPPQNDSYIDYNNNNINHIEYLSTNIAGSEVNAAYSEHKPSIKINQSSSRNILNLRSQSVSSNMKNQSRLSRVQRLFDFEQERSKSRISKLLNQPIDVPSLNQSSFINDLTKKSSRINIRNLLEANEKTVVKSDVYIEDDEDRDQLSNLKGSLQLPQIMNPRNMQNLSSITRNYNQSSSISLAVSSRLNKESQATLIQKVKQIGKKSIPNFKSFQGDQSPREQILNPDQKKDHQLSRDISREQNAFKRQKMLFDLLDQAKDRNLGEKSIEALFNKKNLLQNARSRADMTPEMKKNFSVLKSENANSSIIKNITPTFPLQKDLNLFQTIQMENDEELKIKIADVIKSKNPLSQLLNYHDIEKMLDLEQAIYRNKMDGMNEVMNQKLDDVKLKYLDDDYLYKKFKEQIELKAKTKGRKISNNKQNSEFSYIKWPKLKDLFDHQGNQISKSGLKMDEEQAQKEQEEEMMKKLNQKVVSLSPQESLRKRKPTMVSNTSLEHGSNSEEDDYDQTSDGAQTLQNDQQYQSELKNIELKDLVQQQELLERKMKKLEQKRSRTSRKHLEKMKQQYDKLKQEYQDRIKQIKEQMTQEEEEYWNEQNQLKKQSLLGNLDNFLDQKKDEIQQLGEEIFKLENDSDDEYGIYQNFTNTQAHLLAKLKVKQEEQQSQKYRFIQKMLITNKSDVMKNIYDGIKDAQSKNGIKEFSTRLNTQVIQDATNNSGLNKVMDAAIKKQEFGKLIQEVYEKKEDIVFLKKKQRVINEETIEAENHTTGGEEEDLSKKSDEDQMDIEKELKKYEQDDFEKDEILEQQQLEYKLKQEQQLNMARKYLQFCKNEKVLPLPILNKIVDGILSLEDYKLNFGLCKALGSVLDDLGNLIHKIVLKNNGINDVCYSMILEGALQNPFIKSLHLKSNEFREESLNKLLDYFKNEKNPNLEEIVISNCKQKLSQTNQLLKALSDYSKLKVLALCQSKLDKESVLLLADIANGNTNLRELDLSWNEVTSHNMWELIQNIEFCRHIQYLNLSFNSFAGHKTQDLVQSLTNMIRRNRNLLHLDISYCGLRKDEVLQIMVACKKSRSLLAVHISGNLINDDTKKKIRDYMRPRRRVKDLYDQINNPDDEAETSDIPKATNSNIDLRAAIQYKLMRYQKQEAESVKQETAESNAKKGIPGERLIFSRILGHFEIPKSYKWQESTDCWLCEKYRYTVIVASKSLARQNFKKPISTKEKKIYSQKIKDAKHKWEESVLNDDFDQCWGSDNDEIYYEADNEQDRDLIYLNQQVASTFSRWKLKSLMPIQLFLNKLRKNQEDNVKNIQLEKSIYEKQIQDYKVKVKEKQQLKLQRQKELSSNPRNILKFDESGAPWYDKNTDDDQASLMNWVRDLDNLLPFKNQDNLVISMEKMIEFMHNTCLVYNTINIPLKDIYSFTTVVRPREELIKIRHKRVKEYKIERIFDKSNSMFKEYIEDNPKILKAAFQKDIDNSKLARFIKDIFEYRRVCDVLIEYTALIKDIFTYSIALSSFPSISWIDFTNLCTQWQIPDNKTCTMQTIDRVFIATNVELVEQEDNPDRDLCRFELYEIIVRMGGAKYKDSGQVDSWDEATRKIILKNLKPNTKFQGGQSFRDKYIWILPIDDLFRANIDYITKLYNKYTNTGKKWMDLDDCKECMSPLQISEASLKQCYAFSKMTIIDEMNQKDKYERMVICEFLDFICRCAYVKFIEDSHLSILEKVERVLDLLFKTIDCRRLQAVASEQQAHLKSLQEKLVQIESLGSDQTYAEPVRKLQEEIYQQLLVLRENIAQTIEVAIQNQSTLPVQQSEPAQQTAAVTQEEYNTIRDENVRLKYRVQHLLKTIIQIEAKQNQQ